MNANLRPGDADTAEPRAGTLRPGPAAGRSDTGRGRREPTGLLPARSRRAGALRPGPAGRSVARRDGRRPASLLPARSRDA